MKKTNKNRRMSLPLTLLLLTFLYIGLTNGTQDNKYKIQKLGTTETIFFEYLGKTRIYHEEWKIVIGYDFAHIAIELEKINELYVNTATNLCLRQQKISHIKFTCSSYHRLLKRIENLSNVRGELRNAFYIAGIRLNNSSRVRRGIFDFVGEISKMLFGTLDTSCYLL